MLRIEYQKKMQASVVSLLALSIAGCATMNREECLIADWRSVGFEDGRDGELTSYVRQHRKACAEHGVTPDLEQYLAGHSQGIAEYCQPDNAFQMGLRGRSYRGECPAGMDAAFVERHAEGYGLYERREKVDQLRREIERNRTKISEIQLTMNQKRRQLSSPDTPPEQRASIRAEIDQLFDQEQSRQREVWRLERRLRDAVSDLENYQSILNFR